MNTDVDKLCTCMGLVFSPPDHPIEHADSCPLRKAVMEYRSHIPGVPHEADDCWTRDRDEAEEEVEAFHALGDARYRLDRRLVMPAEYDKQGGPDV